MNINININILKYFFIIALSFISQNIFCQNSIPLTELIKNDTIRFSRIAKISNPMKDKLTLEDLYLIDSDCVAPNYFIVQIDSNSYVREGSFKEYFVTKIFWVKEIEDLYYERNYYYYEPMNVLINKGYYEYVDGKKNDLTNYFRYLYLFNISNVSLSNNGNYTYLYKSNNIHNTEVIENQCIWERKDNPKIKYVIFNTFFWAMQVYDNMNDRKILVPFSRLLEFEQIYYPSKYGAGNFKMQNKEFFVDKFKLSPLKIKIDISETMRLFEINN